MVCKFWRIIGKLQGAGRFLTKLEVGGRGWEVLLTDVDGGKSGVNLKPGFYSESLSRVFPDSLI